MAKAPTAPAEVSASELATLLDMTVRAVQDCASRRIVVKGSERGRYQLVASIRGYCRHLRRLAQGMGGEEALEEATKQRRKLAKAQAARGVKAAKPIQGSARTLSARGRPEQNRRGRITANRLAEPPPPEKSMKLPFFKGLAFLHFRKAPERSAPRTSERGHASY